MGLKRSLGLPMLTFYGTGMILGAGIYSIIGQAAGKAGYGLWQGFVLAAICALLTALSYAELSAMYPRAGGEYVYLRNAFPSQPWLATTTGIIMTFAGCASAATVALAFSSYLQHFISLPHFWVASGLLSFFTVINLIGIKESSWVNAAFTSIEALGLVLFIWLGWQNPDFGSAFYSIPSSATVSSAALIIFAYFGFENIVNLAEETKTPEKTIPRAILLSLCISTILYILVSFAAVALMPPDQLAKSESALTDAAMNSSREIAGALAGIALFSTANTALIALLTASRILYGVSIDKSLPMAFAKTLRVRQTPWVAALVALGLSIALLPFGKVQTLASVASFATMIAFISVNAALIVLRYVQPKEVRPFKIPLSIKSIPVFPVLGILTCVIFLFQFETQIYLVGILSVACSAGIYFLYANFKKKRPNW
jgi:APA family basic amino acid/polyamine antiporter